MEMMRGRPWMTALVLIALLCGAVLIGGCTGTDSNKELNETPDRTMNETPTAAITGTGTVTYIDLEGGFYGIVADDGMRYLPMDLDPAFEQDNLSVTFTVEKVDVVTIQQWGTPVKVISIEKA
ncbi:hypothetical protein [Methanofollis ethanolicus]|uniref:hypothetical protein n=1 Tax=Methanofollis ethanolicus TaxID=488124 RepID=UPI00128F6CDD|nr:hypothetical protein [Methanofollis ethanolicus]